MTKYFVEADGGSRGNPGPAGYGALVRDPSTGAILAETAAAIGVASNNVAEYRGLIAGLEAAFALDPQASIEARMDSKLVVEQMSGRWKIKHEDMVQLVAQARALVGARKVTFTWIPRARNSAADRLANEAMDDAAAGLPWRGPGGSAPAPEVAGSPMGEAPDPEPAPAPGRLPSNLGPPSRLVLVRHGETALTGQRRFSGSDGPDHELTVRGRAQAQAAADALLHEDEPFVAVVCSPVLRALQTAEVIAAQLGLSVRPVPDWRECAFGAWDGLTSAEVAAQWPDEFAAWAKSLSAVPPGGESFAAVEARVRVAKDRLLARYPRGRVLVVSHSVPIRSMARQASGGPSHALWRLEVFPAAITRTHWWADGHASLISFNETGHLRPLGLALT